jgi:hypothetical protein
MADGSAIILPEVRVGFPTAFDLAWLAMHMRADEQAQWCALTGRGEYDADLCARGMAAIGGVSWCLYGRDGRPFCAGGFEEVRPKVWQTWMAGTDEGWKRHWRTITKEARRCMAGLFAHGAQRIQTYALASRTEAHEWYRRGLLQDYEGTHRAFFADGQDGVCYARAGG